MKAFLRGQIIAYSISSNKNKRLQFDNITKAISDIDQDLTSNPNPELSKKRLDLQSQADLISTSAAEKLLLKTKGLYFEHGDKSSRLMSHQLRRQTAARLIPQMKDCAGTLQTAPPKINDAFVAFYSSLYRSESPPDSTNMTNFLASLNCPKIQLEDANNMDEPLEIDELTQSIKLMQNKNNKKLQGPYL